MGGESEKLKFLLFIVQWSMAPAGEEEIPGEDTGEDRQPAGELRENGLFKCINYTYALPFPRLVTLMNPVVKMQRNPSVHPH